MLLVAMVWLVATFASQWHQVVVPHARCPEHGELLQVAHEEQPDEPELAAAPDDQQHDACAFHALGGAFPAPERGDVPVLEIALLTGFSDAAHFSRCFAGKYGVPPRRRRRAAEAAARKDPDIGPERGNRASAEPRDRRGATVAARR